MDERTVSKLIVQSHGRRGFEVRLRAGNTSIGRDPDCDVTLDDSYVSRRHADITLRGGQCVLTDNDSTNGTYVGTVLVTGPTVLSDGDEISIGKSQLVYVEVISGKRPTKPLTSPPARLRQPSVIVDVDSREVWIEGVRLMARFSPLEFALLAYLYERANSVCTRDELGAAIWGQGTGAFSPEMLHQLVHRLKAKFEPDPNDPHYILSVPGVGYRLLVTGDTYGGRKG